MEQAVWQQSCWKYTCEAFLLPPDTLEQSRLFHPPVSIDRQDCRAEGWNRIFLPLFSLCRGTQLPFWVHLGLRLLPQNQCCCHLEASYQFCSMLRWRLPVPCDCVRLLFWHVL